MDRKYRFFVRFIILCGSSSHALHVVCGQLSSLYGKRVAEMGEVSFCLCASLFVTSANIFFEVHYTSPRTLHAQKTVNRRKFCAVNHKTERNFCLRK